MKKNSIFKLLYLTQSNIGIGNGKISFLSPVFVES